MDESEIKKIVRNMIPSRDRENAILKVVDHRKTNKNTMISDSFSDYTSRVKIIGIPKDTSLMNGKWHEGHGYEMEFLGVDYFEDETTKEEVEGIKVLLTNKDKEKVLLEILKPAK